MVLQFVLALKVAANFMTIVFCVKNYLDLMIKMLYLLYIGIVSEGLPAPFFALSDSSFSRLFLKISH